MKTTEWKIKKFDALSTIEFHDIIQLREKIFVVEQDCPYLDVDGQDPLAIHVLGISNNLIATARIFPPDKKGFVVIGRICTHASARGNGLGRELVKQCLSYIKENWKYAPIKISAQCYLIKFYESFGFKIVGEEYLEDGIPHITMTIAS